MGASSRGARWPSRWTSLCRCPQLPCPEGQLPDDALHPLQALRCWGHPLPWHATGKQLAVALTAQRDIGALALGAGASSLCTRVSCGLVSESECAQQRGSVGSLLTILRGAATCAGHRMPSVSFHSWSVCFCVLQHCLLVLCISSRCYVRAVCRGSGVQYGGVCRMQDSLVCCRNECKAVFSPPW